MTKQEKTAIARIFSDLIMADRIVDKGEMECWRELCARHDLDRDIRIAARDISFEEAVKTVSASLLGRDILGDCRRMTVSDGFCAHPEALIMMALAIMFSSAPDLAGEVYSIPRASFDIDIATAIYVEGDDDPETNEAIRANYRSIFKEFQLAGFHFIYIPKVIEHYHDTDPALFRDILAFLAPVKKDPDIERAYAELMKMTTASYCKDLLCNKCGFTELRNTPPAVLIKIGNSFVGDVRYANYLKIEVDEDILLTVRTFIDGFSRMLRSDIFVVNTSEERGDQFHFHGFYKQLLDIFLIEQKKQSGVVVDLTDRTIRFPDLEHTELSLHRKEKAFYVAMLCQGSGGIRFSLPRGASAAEEKRYAERMKRFQARYESIYRLFGAETDRVPDVADQKIRNPMIASIRKAVRAFADLKNPDDYCITNTAGSYAIHVDPARVKVLTPEKSYPLHSSPLYKNYGGRSS